MAGGQQDDVGLLREGTTLLFSRLLELDEGGEYIFALKPVPLKKTLFTKLTRFFLTLKFERAH